MMRKHRGHRAPQGTPGVAKEGKGEGKLQNGSGLLPGLNSKRDCRGLGRSAGA